MSWHGNIRRDYGDPLDPSDHNLLIESLDNLLGAQDGNSNVPLDASLLPQPFQVSKPSVLLLEVEGVASPDFPNAAYVYLSSDGIVFTEVAVAQFIFQDISEAKTLIVPIPKDWFCEFVAPYGFIKSALLF